MVPKPYSNYSGPYIRSPTFQALWWNQKVTTSYEALAIPFESVLHPYKGWRTLPRTLRLASFAPGIRRRLCHPPAPCGSACSPGCRVWGLGFLHGLVEGQGCTIVSFLSSCQIQVLGFRAQGWVCMQVWGGVGLKQTAAWLKSGREPNALETTTFL